MPGLKRKAGEVGGDDAVTRAPKKAKKAAPSRSRSKKLYMDLQSSAEGLEEFLNYELERSQKDYWGRTIRKELCKPEVDQLIVYKKEAKKIEDWYNEQVNEEVTPAVLDLVCDIISTSNPGDRVARIYMSGMKNSEQACRSSKAKDSGDLEWIYKSRYQTIDRLRRKAFNAFMTTPYAKDNKKQKPLLKIVVLRIQEKFNEKLREDLYGLGMDTRHFHSDIDRLSFFKCSIHTALTPHNVTANELKQGCFWYGTHPNAPQLSLTLLPHFVDGVAPVAAFTNANGASSASAAAPLGTQQHSLGASNSTAIAPAAHLGPRVGANLALTATPEQSLSSTSPTPTSRPAQTPGVQIKSEPGDEDQQISLSVLSRDGEGQTSLYSLAPFEDSFQQPSEGGKWSRQKTGRSTSMPTTLASTHGPSRAKLAPEANKSELSSRLMFSATSPDRGTLTPNPTLPRNEDASKHRVATGPPTLSSGSYQKLKLHGNVETFSLTSLKSTCNGQATFAQSNLTAQADAWRTGKRANAPPLQHFTYRGEQEDQNTTPATKNSHDSAVPERTDLAPDKKDTGVSVAPEIHLASSESWQGDAVAAPASGSSEALSQKLGEDDDDISTPEGSSLAQAPPTEQQSNVKVAPPQANRGVDIPPSDNDSTRKTTPNNGDAGTQTKIGAGEAAPTSNMNNDRIEPVEGFRGDEDAPAEGLCDGEVAPATNTNDGEGTSAGGVEKDKRAPVGGLSNGEGAPGRGLGNGEATSTRGVEDAYLPPGPATSIHQDSSTSEEAYDLDEALGGC